jgi:hypothetical protein
VKVQFQVQLPDLALQSRDLGLVVGRLDFLAVEPTSVVVRKPELDETG